MKKSIDIVLVGFMSEEFLPRLRKDIETMTAFPRFVHYFDNIGNPKTLSALWNDLAAAGSAEYIAIMNPDIALSPGWDKRLIKALSDDKTLGIATPDPCGSSPTAAPMPSVQTMKEIAKEYASDKRVTTEDVQFYLAVIRRTVWESLKGVDERMRFYMQDSDFLRRAKERLGLSAGRVHSCPVWHQGSASTGEAIRKGQLNQKLEYDTSLEVHRDLSAGRLKDWDLMTALERSEVRQHPKYGRMGQ
jgi:hypothetical protein